jgi:hypothetical protein
MNIKIEKEKKVYVAPSMDIVNMDHELILCCSAGGDGCPDEEEGEDIINATRFKFEFN